MEVIDCGKTLPLMATLDEGQNSLAPNNYEIMSKAFLIMLKIKPQDPRDTSSTEAGKRLKKTLTSVQYSPQPPVRKYPGENCARESPPGERKRAVSSSWQQVGQ